MPKRNRTRETKRSGHVVAVERVPSKQEQDVKLFAESVRAEEAAAKRARAEAVEAIRRANVHDELKAAKATAVSDLKAARARGGNERIVAAEAAYRKALAELQEFETGERPTWAPPPPADDSSDADGATEDVTDAPSIEGDPAE